MQQLMDGFDHYANVDAQRKGWSLPFALAMAPGRFGAGQSAKWYPFGSTQPNRYPFKQASSSKVFIGFAWQFQNIVSEAPVMELVDAGVTQLTLTWDGQANLFRFRQGSGIAGTVLGTSAVQQLTVANWHYIDLAVGFNNATGSIHLNLDGVADIIAVSNVDTVQSANSYVTHFSLPASSNVGGDVQFWYDDLYGLDDFGSDSNVAIGDVRIYFQPAIADGAHLDFTPSTPGDHYSTVNKAIVSTSSFISDNTVGHIDTFKVRALALSNVIKGAQIVLAAAKDDAAARQIAPLVRSNATDYPGSNFPLSASIQICKTLQPLDPNTNQPWTTTAFNAAEFGVKITQ